MSDNNEINEFISMHIKAGSEDVQLIDKLNHIINKKYENMYKNTKQLLNEQKKLDTTYDEIKDNFQAINQLSDTVDKLDVIINSMDQYSLDLLHKYQNIYNNK